MENKTCGMCKQEFPKTSEFFATKGKAGLQSNCKECHKEYRKKHYKEKKDLYLQKSYEWKDKAKAEFLDFLKKQFCMDCGINNHLVLEFDHVIGIKDFNISKLIGRYKLDSPIMQEELAKCEVVCANCHRIRTYSRMNSYKNK